MSIRSTTSNMNKRNCHPTPRPPAHSTAEAVPSSPGQQDIHLLPGDQLHPYPEHCEAALIRRQRKFAWPGVGIFDINIYRVGLVKFWAGIGGGIIINKSLLIRVEGCVKKRVRRFRGVTAKGGGSPRTCRNCRKFVSVTSRWKISKVLTAVGDEGSHDGCLHVQHTLRCRQPLQAPLELSRCHRRSIVERLSATGREASARTSSRASDTRTRPCARARLSARMRPSTA